MTDYELNKAIAESMGKFQGKTGDWKPNAVNMTDIEGFHIEFDFNNWNDLMPLVEKYDITLYKCMASLGWQAFNGGIGTIEISVHNEKPQRALAECLLKLLESKDE